jgi:hypothetical protein
MSGRLLFNERGQILPQPKLKLRAGMKGTIYIDPFSRLRVDSHNATLVSPGQSQPVKESTVGDLEQWHVTFPGEPGQYLRWVNVKDFKA